jgi:hypothetical protein
MRAGYRRNMAKTKDQTKAIRRRSKLADNPDPMATPDATEPNKGTSAWFFWAYGQAYARGISKATGKPSTPPVVAGPNSTLVQTMIVHARDADGKKLKGEAVLEWLENVVCDFKTHADERDYGRGIHAWGTAAFARWLDAGRPKAHVIQGATAPDRRAHISVRKA